MAGVREAITKAIMGIKAYHSSPHDFDRFDLGKIRSGQGSNSYGPGIYAAENKAVSGQGGEYWDEFSRHPKFDVTEKDAAGWLALHNFDRQKAALSARRQLESNMDFSRSVRSPEELQALAAERAKFEKVVQMLEGDAPVGPRTYELNIRAQPDQFLQWDKTLAEQPHIVEALPKLLDAAKDEAYGRAVSSTNKVRADQLWDMVKHPERATGSLAWQELAVSPEKSMDALHGAGVPGIRYADQHTRQLLGEISNAERTVVNEQAAGRKSYGAWEEEVARLKAQPQTYNYVLNDPGIIDITKKYGVLPGAVMGGIAAQDQYEAQ